MARQYVLHAQLPGSEVWVGERAAAVPWTDGIAPIQVVRGLGMGEEPVITLDGSSLEAVSVDLVRDVLGLLEIGPYGASAVCEVALLEDGDDWSKRETVIAGARVVSLSQTLGGEWSLRLEKDLERDSAMALTAHTIKESYAGTLFGVRTYYNTGDHDQPWPTAVGRCYGVPLIRWAYGSSDDLALCTGHHLPAGDVPIFDRGVEFTGSRSPLTPKNSSISPASDDLPPQRFSYFEGGSGTSSINGRSWEDEDGSLANYCEGLSVRLAQGGCVNSRGEVVLGAGMVLEHMLRESKIAVDWPRMARTLRLLQGWDIGVYIDGRESWLAIIRDRLLPVLPLIEHESDQGLWYSYHVPWQTQPRGTLVSGRDFSMVSGIEWDMDIVNTVVVKYAYDYSVGEYTKQITTGPDHSPVCSASAGASAFGVRQDSQPLTSTVVHTESAAIMVGRTIAERNAVPRRTFSVLMRSAQWEGLLPGETLFVQDAALGAAPVWCQVMQVPRRRWPGVVLFETIERAQQGTPKA